MIINSIPLFILSNNLLFLPIDLDSLILVLFISVASLGLVTILYSRKKAAEIVIGAIGIGAGIITSADSGLNLYDRFKGGKSNPNNNNGGSSSGNSNEGNKSNEGNNSNSGNNNNGKKKKPLKSMKFLQQIFQYIFANLNKYFDFELIVFLIVELGANHT